MLLLLLVVHDDAMCHVRYHERVDSEEKEVQKEAGRRSAVVLVGGGNFGSGGGGSGIDRRGLRVEGLGVFMI